MRLTILFGLVFAVTLLLPPELTAAADLVHHELTAEIDPQSHRISAEDTITVPDGFPSSFSFRLHGNLDVTFPADGETKIERLAAVESYIPLTSYTVTLPAGQRRFTVRYTGTINHPPEAHGREYARGFQQTPGIISADGVYLSDSSFWYPVLDIGRLSFAMRVTMPHGWNSVSQGDLEENSMDGNRNSNRWICLQPQEEIFLIAAPYEVYTRRDGPFSAMVFLREPDEKLANKYLDVTIQYVSLYEKLLGPYPYGKFALVENFWETGYGMPSFTLLGPKVLRFPFILHSSYPHEILHNWWGNSVYPDFMAGNWSEGLTAYLADHLTKEQRGNGQEYRQTTLQKYTDYASKARDFPLTEFRSRHSSATEAVGYGKSLMLFHMLRGQVGDPLFIKALQHFYEENLYQTASWDDLLKSFEKVSGTSLAGFFSQWLTRTGAPSFMVSDPVLAGNTLTFNIEQVQAEPPYTLQVPVAVSLAGANEAFQATVQVSNSKEKVALTLPSGTPLRLDVDPEFDIFRRLDRNEIPPALSEGFGARRATIVLPSSCLEGLRESYQILAQAWKGSGPEEVQVVYDDKLEGLPQDSAIALFGWENRFFDDFTKTLNGQDISFGREHIRLGATDVSKTDHAVVLASRHPKNPERAFSLVAIDNPASAAGLGRKLPHYHKYSYLAFQGAEPENVAKGRWEVTRSPLTLFLTEDKIPMATLAKRQPLATLPQVFSKSRMLDTISFLASDTMHGRGFGSSGLERAASYITEELRAIGLDPGGSHDNSFDQRFGATGGKPEKTVELKNIIGLLPGNDPQLKNELVVVGAHYDHLGTGWPDVHAGDEGKIHPGADDNASGIAVLLELARIAKESLQPDRTIAFVAFSGEEAGRLGSEHFVKAAAAQNQKIFAMINLDTVGRLGAKKLLVLGGNSAREWVHIFRGAGFVTGVEMETVSEMLDASDQTSFIASGIPAVQLFSGPHPDYHRPTDTADKIDADGLLKVASVAKEAIEYLTGREAHMTPSGAVDTGLSHKNKGPRKISLGTVPDFAYTGEGYRLSGVTPGSPAEQAGLVEGDIIVAINDSETKGIRDLSAILKTLHAGEEVTVTFLRSGRKKSVTISVVER